MHMTKFLEAYASVYDIGQKGHFLKNGPQKFPPPPFQSLF